MPGRTHQVCSQPPPRPHFPRPPARISPRLLCHPLVSNSYPRPAFCPASFAIPSLAICNPAPLPACLLCPPAPQPAFSPPSHRKRFSQAIVPNAVVVRQYGSFVSARAPACSNFRCSHTAGIITALVAGRWHNATWTANAFGVELRLGAADRPHWPPRTANGQDVPQNTPAASAPDQGCVPVLTTAAPGGGASAPDAASQPAVVRFVTAGRPLPQCAAKAPAKATADKCGGNPALKQPDTAYHILTTVFVSALCTVVIAAKPAAE